MWGTTPDQDNNNVAQPAPNRPGQADTPLHGEFAPDRRMVRDADLCPRFLVVSGVLRRQQQMVDPAAHL